jgi:hypothetical protein
MKLSDIGKSNVWRGEWREIECSWSLWEILQQRTNDNEIIDQQIYIY